MKRKPILILTTLAAAVLGLVSLRLVTGCALVGESRTDARAAAAVALREAYSLGGAEMVSNRIEQLVSDGKVTPAQAAALHVLAQRVYDRAIERLETEAILEALDADCDACGESMTNGTPTALAQ